MADLPATVWLETLTLTTTITLYVLLCASASVVVCKADVPMRRGSRQIEPSIPQQLPLYLANCNTTSPPPHPRTTTSLCSHPLCELH